MLKYLLVLLLGVHFSYCQEKLSTSTYKYGYNGMELIVKSSKETIIISTYNSKKTIKDEIAKKVYDQFKSNEFKTGDTICLAANEAKVTGKCFITKKGKLTSLNFYYERVEWNSGLTEIYKKV